MQTRERRGGGRQGSTYPPVMSGSWYQITLCKDLHHNVSWLDISVNNVVAVDVCDPCDKLIGEHEDSFEAKPPGPVWSFKSTILSSMIEPSTIDCVQRRTDRYGCPDFRNTKYILMNARISIFFLSMMDFHNISTFFSFFIERNKFFCFFQEIVQLNIFIQPYLASFANRRRGLIIDDKIVDFEPHTPRTKLEELFKGCSQHFCHHCIVISYRTVNKYFHCIVRNCTIGFQIEYLYSILHSTLIVVTSMNWSKNKLYY